MGVYTHIFGYMDLVITIEVATINLWPLPYHKGVACQLFFRFC